MTPPPWPELIGWEQAPGPKRGQSECLPQEFGEGAEGPQAQSESGSWRGPRTEPVSDEKSGANMWREARDSGERWGDPKSLLILVPGCGLALGFQETPLQRFIKFLVFVFNMV